MRYAIVINMFLLAIIFSIYLDNGNDELALPRKLREISGICFLDDHTLACVQDEKGIIFIYDIIQKKIISECKFGPDGDYEGIAIRNNDAFVITGDGVLYEIGNFLKNPLVKTYNINLNEGSETESIFYENKNDRLLIAFKNKKKKYVEPAIYSYNPSLHQFDSINTIRVNIERRLFPNHKKSDLKAFWSPSDLTINYQKNEIYVIDAINCNLLIIDINGEMKKVIELDANQFPHPEGIAVNSVGDVFICNDGQKGGVGNIIKFKIDN